MAKEVVLLNLFDSPFATRVRIALEEKGIDYELREEDVLNKSPLLLEMNPLYRQVPVLIHKGRPICESLIVIEYIDEVWNHKFPLLPSDPYERANARFWAEFADKKMFPAGRMMWSAKGEAKDTAKKGFIENCRVLEGELGDKPYFGGENFGFLDLVVISFYHLFYTFETLGNFSMEAECPKLLEWAKRCMQKDSVSKSLADPYKSYEHGLELKKKLFFGS